jgi:hypothetical protein
VPAIPLTVAARAVESSEIKRGMAKAARMPRIVITTTSSISVKPRILEGVMFCSEALARR